MHCIDTGIVISPDNVTLDLNGYALIGTRDTGKFHGIFLEKVRNIEVKNGTIRDFPDKGIRSADSIR